MTSVQPVWTATADFSASQLFRAWSLKTLRVLDALSTFAEPHRCWYWACRARSLHTDPRLDAWPHGETFALPFGVVSILESARLHPFNDGTWDSRNTIVESEGFGPVTVESLRTLLSKEPFALGSDVLDRNMAEAGASANVVKGIRRNVITKMGLRDQPVLDKYQDEIFRRPLSSQLLLLGPPGTGKTTTFIRRLGQKLDVERLEGYRAGASATPE